MPLFVVIDLLEAAVVRLLLGWVWGVGRKHSFVLLLLIYDVFRIFFTLSDLTFHFLSCELDWNYLVCHLPTRPDYVSKVDVSVTLLGSKEAEHSLVVLHDFESSLSY